MKLGFFFLGIIALGLIIPIASAAPPIQIILEQTTFSYGERLVYTINVTEVTGDLAIIHIRDEVGKGSSAIPIEISELNTVISAPFPFEKQVFPEGKYFIDLQYSGESYTAEFNLIDSGEIVIPYYAKEIAGHWVNNIVSAGIFVDAIDKMVDKKIIEFPNTIDNEHLEKIFIPEWMKIVAVWWVEERISDGTFANAFQYLIDKKIVLV